MYAGIISQLFDNLDEWSSNYWYLGVIFGLAYLDSVLPIVPSELCVIIGGVAVSTGGASYNLWLVIACGAAGAFLGDNSAYGIGKLFAERFERRAARKAGFRKRLQWAHDQLETRGGPLLITARFIPGGRTALTLASGITRQPHRWFMGWAAIAAVVWAGYAAGLAYAIGKPFADNHTAALLVAFGTALVVNVAIEVVRKVRGHAKPAAVPALEAMETAITDPQT